MKIALIDVFPLAQFTAEREFIFRCINVLKRFGHEAILVSTSGQIIEYNPDIVFSTHHLAPKLTEHFTIGALWDPTLFYKNEADRLRSIRSWDLVVPINEAIRQFAVDLHFPMRHRTAISKHILYPSAPVPDFELSPPPALSLVYVGVHWDGNRHEAFFRRLSDEVDLHIYGPSEAWKHLPASYRGSIPFNGNALFETLNRHGAVLALHKETHRRDDTPCMRPFEACAAKCFVITDAMTSLQNLFGDSFNYVDMEGGTERAVRQIKLALESANRERQYTATRIEAAHSVFRQRVSLDALLPPILDEAQAVIARKTSVAVRRVNAPTVSVIIRCGARPLEMISRAVNSVKQQVYPSISLIFARFAAIEGFDAHVSELRDSKRFDDVTVLSVPGRGIRSESMWTGLRAVRTPFFAILDDDDEWFPDHLHHIMEVFEQDKSADFVHSGAIRHDEEQHSPELHPRLRRSDGTTVNEHRALIFCEPFDLNRFLKWENVILSHSFVARSELLTADVLDDPKLEVMEDVYLYLLFMARGAKFAFNSRATAVWNWRVQSNDNSMTNFDDAGRSELGERIVRRLGQHRFPGNYLGQDVIGRVFGAVHTASKPKKQGALHRLLYKISCVSGL